ncbi:MAG: hypothetical protein ACFFB5_18790 [Promethearchaeota archaeon]
MINELLLILFLLIILTIVIMRRMEIVPCLIFWLMARDITSEDDSSLITPDLGLSVEFVEIPTKERPLTALYFPSKIASTAGILMIPNWFQKEDQKNSLKVANILHTIGFNILLPLYHWDLDERHELVFQKRSVCPKEYQGVIEEAYEYFITRSEINKRSVGIWSNATGTILACQLVKNSPIKAVVLEDGPVSLWNNVAAMLQEKRFLKHLTKFVIIPILFPFLWRTRWQSNNAVKDLRACPSFLIAIREDPRKKLWQTYTKLFSSQLWYEHALHPKDISDTWIQEYFMQVRNFYEYWLLEQTSQQPEFHYDFSVERKKKGKFPVEVRVSAIPPQLDDVPLQIILSDGVRFNELRIWFSGATRTITYSLDFKPNNMSAIQFTNVELKKHTQHQKTRWIKRDAEKALFTTIEKIINSPPNKITEQMDRYFFLKSILLNEQQLQEEARETLKTSITSNYWKTLVSREADTRMIAQEDIDSLISISSPESAFLRG